MSLQSDTAVQDCRVDKETMRKQVSGRISFLVRAVELGRGTKAKTEAALGSVSPVGVVSAATVPVPVHPWCTGQQCNWDITSCKVALGYDPLALPEVCVLNNIFQAILFNLKLSRVDSVACN